MIVVLAVIATVMVWLTIVAMQRPQEREIRVRVRDDDPRRDPRNAHRHDRVPHDDRF